MTIEYDEKSRQISSVADLIVQQTRLKNGQHKVTAVTEVAGMEGNITVQTDRFKFDQTGISTDAKVSGEVIAAGIRPNFTLRLEAACSKLGADVFFSEIVIQSICASSKHSAII